MWRNADPSSKEMREENKNPHVKESGEQQTQQDLTCEECRKHLEGKGTMCFKMWRKADTAFKVCGERQTPSRHLEERGVIKIKVLLVCLCINR